MQTLNSDEKSSSNATINQSLVEGGKMGGCYVLRRDLSKAGGETVWLATDEVLGKEVTLHFVPSAVAGDASAMAELRQEVKRNRQLIHPNILRVYDLVEDGNRAAVSMDLFEGESLADALKRKGRFDPDEVKPLLGQLAETLGDAHRIQLFHRDLSPANLFIRPTGGPLVVNFGLSRVILNALDRAGIVKGEDAHMSYLSPQQLDGEKARASDDVYGFGALLFELLAGKPPFSGTDIIAQIRKNLPPSVSSVRAEAGAAVPVPQTWEKLIASCLAKTPEGRPRSLADVQTMLGQEHGRAAEQAVPVANAPAAVVAEVKSQVEEPAGHGVLDKTSGGVPGGGGATTASSEAILPSKAEDAGTTSAGARETASESSSSRSLPGAKSKEHLETPPFAPKPPTRKTPVKGALSANFPDLDRPRSKAPLVWLVLAALVIGVFIAQKYFLGEDGEQSESSVDRIDHTADARDDADPLIGAPGTGSADSGTPAPLADPTPVESTSGGVAVATAPDPAAGVPPKSSPGGRETLITEAGPRSKGSSATELIPDTLATAAGRPEAEPAESVKPDITSGSPPDPVPVPPAKPADASATNAGIAVSLPQMPAPLPKLVLPPKPTLEQLEQMKRERETALAKIREAAASVESVRLEYSRRLETATSEQEKRQKGFDAKRKVLVPVIQQADSSDSERKKLEEGMVKAKAAAAEAAKAAEAARQAYEDAIAKGADRAKAKTEAEVELRNATAEMVSKGKEIEELAQTVAKADALHQRAISDRQQAEQDLQKIASSAEQARKGDMEQQRKANLEKAAVLQKRLQELKTQAARYNSALATLKELGETEAVKKIEDQANGVNRQIGSVESEIKTLTGSSPAAAPTAAPEVKANPESPHVSNATNSLGMTFVPVANDIQFGVHLVTRKDFDSFANAVALKSEAWRNPGFKQDPDHPVVNVTWREAEAFCKWLTEKERKAGLLKTGEVYRLPTDLEWSKAVGLPPEPGATPEERDMGVKDIYPWGTKWPPPQGAGNYAGEETQTEIPIEGYNDGYANTSPVGKFTPNALGLYDMGGNVWQWVSDSWNSDNRAKTLRGGSWYNGAIPLSLLSSCRISSSQDTLHDTYGFRIVKAVESGRGKRR